MTYVHLPRGSPQPSKLLEKKTSHLLFWSSSSNFVGAETCTWWILPIEKVDCPVSINELCQFTQCLVPTKMYWQRSPKVRRTSRIAKHWPPLIRFKLAWESCIPSLNHKNDQRNSGGTLRHRFNLIDIWYLIFDIWHLSFDIGPIWTNQSASCGINCIDTVQST